MYWAFACSRTKLLNKSFESWSFHNFSVDLWKKLYKQSFLGMSSENTGKPQQLLAKRKKVPMDTSELKNYSWIKIADPL